MHQAPAWYAKMQTQPNPCFWRRFGKPERVIICDLLTAPPEEKKLSLSLMSLVHPLDPLDQLVHPFANVYHACMEEPAWEPKLPHKKEM